MAVESTAPPDPGQVVPPKLSFATVLNAPPTPMHDFSGSPPLRGSHKGEPAGFFSSDLIGVLAQPYRYALVGKFSKGRPSMEKIHEFFKAQDFVDTFTVGLLDPRHILVNFHGERDFHQFYSRMLWYVGDFPMCMFKWSSDFHVERESSIVPVWFKFPKLPVHFFQPRALFFLASLFGSPLRLDSATQSLKRPSVARIQVEVDLLKKLPSRVWIGTGENQGFWQKVEPDEDLPLYCPHCWHVGHSEATCMIKHPELKVRKPLPNPKPRFRNIGLLKSRSNNLRPQDCKQVTNCRSLQFLICRLYWRLRRLLSPRLSLPLLRSLGLLGLLLKPCLPE